VGVGRVRAWLRRETMARRRVRGVLLVGEGRICMKCVRFAEREVRQEERKARRTAEKFAGHLLS
jgi:hypothetical protein